MSTTRVKQLMTFEGYLQVFHDNCRITKTYYQAWTLTEDEYFNIFGQNRYSCYHSFATVRGKNTKNKVKHS
jgi:hypothetical protein